LENPDSHEEPPGQKSLLIASFIGTQALGDFVGYHLALASVVRRFPGSRLLVLYRADRDYKPVISRLNPYVTDAVALPPDSGIVVPSDWFDPTVRSPHVPFGERWYREGYHRPDLFMTGSMMMGPEPTCVGPAPLFRFPENLTPLLRQSLRNRGLDTDRWFVCVHMREPGYIWRKGITPIRCVDPGSYVPMIEHIIDVHGGQVVRLGDSTMAPLPEKKGFVDLAWDPTSFPEQAFAISRARFCVGTDTGPTVLSGAFGIPTAMTNALGIGVWRDGDVMLPKRNLTLADGTVLDSREGIEMFAASETIPDDLSCTDNTPEELCRVSDHMVEATKAIQGWRDTPVPEPPATPAGAVALPLEPFNNSMLGDLVWM